MSREDPSGESEEWRLRERNGFVPRDSIQHHQQVIYFVGTWKVGLADHVAVRMAPTPHLFVVLGDDGTLFPQLERITDCSMTSQLYNTLTNSLILLDHTNTPQKKEQNNRELPGGKETSHPIQRPPHDQ
jgi:hypothetical protein